MCFPQTIIWLPGGVGISDDLGMSGLENHHEDQQCENYTPEDSPEARISQLNPSGCRVHWLHRSN